MRYDLRADSEIISKTEECKKVLIIAQPGNNEWDPFSAIVWIRYEILPIECNGIIITKDNSKMFDGLRSISFTNDKLVDYIKRNNYTHVYVYSVDEYFSEEFYNLFEPIDNLNKKILYTPNGEYLLSFVEVSQ